MNRWEIVFSGVLVVLTLFSFLVERGASTASNIRQRSDGCGPHPLIALAAASRPFGNTVIICLTFFLSFIFMRSIQTDTCFCMYAFLLRYFYLCMF